jgi:DNA-binding MarR family transcriptional regulator
MTTSPGIICRWAILSWDDINVFFAEHNSAGEGTVQLRKAERRYHLTTRHYAQLAAWRRALRTFLRFSERAGADVGLGSQQYQAMLVVRGWAEERPVTIGDLAGELFIKHNSAVGLVDRLVRQGLVTRATSSADRRKVELALTPRGRTVLAALAALHRRELRRLGPVFNRFLAAVSS